MLSACADNRAFSRDEQDATDFGHAVREDLTAQIVNPEPNYKTPPPGADGARTTLNNVLYRIDSVKQPTAATTSSVSGGGP
jgi:hypothetical protein